MFIYFSYFFFIFLSIGALLFLALKTHTKVHHLFKGPESDNSSSGQQFNTKYSKDGLDVTTKTSDV